jgi:hypothetical protein
MGVAARVSPLTMISIGCLLVPVLAASATGAYRDESGK